MENTIVSNPSEGYSTYTTLLDYMKKEVPALFELFIQQDKTWNDWLFDFCFGDVIVQEVKSNNLYQRLIEHKKR
jgi:hypothetical protein